MVKISFNFKQLEVHNLCIAKKLVSNDKLQIRNQLSIVCIGVLTSPLKNTPPSLFQQAVLLNLQTVHTPPPPPPPPPL